MLEMRTEDGRSPSVKRRRSAAPPTSPSVRPPPVMFRTTLYTVASSQQGCQDQRERLSVPVWGATGGDWVGRPLNATVPSRVSGSQLLVSFRSCCTCPVHSAEIFWLTDRRCGQRTTERSGTPANHLLESTPRADASAIGNLSWYKRSARSKPLLPGSIVHAREMFPPRQSKIKR